MRKLTIEIPVLRDEFDTNPRIGWAWLHLLGECTIMENGGRIPVNTSAAAWRRMLPGGVSPDELTASGHLIRDGEWFRVKGYDTANEAGYLAQIAGGKKGGPKGGKFGKLGAEFGVLGGRPRNNPPLPSRQGCVSKTVSLSKGESVSGEEETEGLDEGEDREAEDDRQPDEWDDDRAAGGVR
jgi:hypothetical protein